MFAGIATLDVVCSGAEPVRPGHKTRNATTWLGAGGPATNAAICAARLTGAATLVTAIGTGPAAGLVRAELTSRNVTVVDCAPTGFEPPVACAIVDDDGERTVVSPGARTSTVEPGPAALAALTGAGVLLVDGHHPGLAEAARRAMPGRGTPGRPVVVVDAGSVKPAVEDWLTDWVDVLAGSADYAAGLGLSAEDACRHALAAGVGAALITQGAGDVVWATADGSQGRITPPPVTARDTLGAGGVFHGALVAALHRLAGQPVRSALPVAIRAAGAVAAAAVADPTPRGWLSLDLARPLP